MKGKKCIIVTSTEYEVLANFFDTLYTMLDPDDYSFDQTKDILYDLFNEFPHCDGDSEIVIFNRGDEV